MKITRKLIFLIFTFLAITASAYAELPNTPKGGPVMTVELMERLIKLVRDQTESSILDARLCKVLDLCDGAKDMPVMLGQSDSTDGIHFLAVPLKIDSKDIIIAVKHGTVVETYLTDKSLNLRAAAVLENKIAHLITNEKAAAKFKAELSLFAGEAADLPPISITSPGSK